MTSEKSVLTAVVDAAIRLVQDSEIGALTLDPMAAKAGVAKAACYIISQTRKRF